jgi:hypothetical protein
MQTADFDRADKQSEGINFDEILRIIDSAPDGQASCRDVRELETPTLC